MQAALAVARLVAGRSGGDAMRSLAEWMERIGGRDDVPEDYADEIKEAAGRLKRRRFP